LNSQAESTVPVVMYTRSGCSFCVAARSLMKEKGVEWEEVSLDEEPDRRVEMIRRSRRTTVPQIFIGEFHVGGFDDLEALNERGELDRHLQAEKG